MADGRRRRRPRLGMTGARFPHGVEEDVEYVPPVLDPTAGDGAHAAGPVDDRIGHTGARFARRPRSVPEPEAVPEADEPGPGAGPVGVPDVVPAPPAAPPPSDPRVPAPPAEPVVPLAADPGMPSVRPYVRTRGRTRARTDLAVETLVSVPSPRPALVDPEHRAIGAVCEGPRSVAEVAARLSVPLGVARVLIDDMATEGLLVVHASAAGPGPNGLPDLRIMERVLAGLHRL